MKVTPSSLPEVLLVEPKVHQDARGYFLETYHQARYADSGIRDAFVQDNVSFSSRGVLRGLHYQKPGGQGKLVSVLMGEIFDVAVEIRKGSPRFGKWFGARLTGENHHQLWVPDGFAHGFVVLSEKALVTYKCTALYSPQTEHCVLWDDPDIGIEWPLKKEVELSGKDKLGKRLKDIPVQELPEMR